jgi:serine/threonine protein phosphatase PrpC
MINFLGALVALGGASSYASTDCPPHGCPLVPLDIISDANANEALRALRSVKADGNEERIEALEALVSAGDADKTTLTLRGNKGGPAEDQINQDRAMIYSPYLIEGSNKQSQLLGVFDGHGSAGEVTSEHAVTEIPKLLAEKLASISLDDDEAVSKAIKETFVEVDKTDPSNSKGGSTATIVLQLGPKLYVGNTGDSISFISVLINEEVHVVYMSREDKPELPDERARILKMGGYVNIPSDPEEDVPRAYSVDKDGRLGHGVAMSRSIGDWEVQGLIAEPIVDVLDVSNIIEMGLAYYAETCREGAAEDDSESSENSDNTCEAIDPRDICILAVSATDGLMDFVDPEAISKIFAAAFYVDGNAHPHSAAEYLILQAAEMWDMKYRGQYRDDIAVSAFKVMSSDSILSEGSKA